VHDSSVVIPEDFLFADDPFVAVLDRLQPVLVADAGGREQTQHFVWAGRRCLEQTRPGFDHVTDPELVPGQIARSASDARSLALSMRPDVRAPISFHGDLDDL
jgi:hypothetical protein